MDINKQTAGLIKNARIKKGFKAEYVAHLMGISQSCYTKFENGNSEITLKKLHSFSSALGIPIQKLIPVKSIESLGKNDQILDRLFHYIKNNEDLIFL